MGARGRGSGPVRASSGGGGSAETRNLALLPWLYASHSALFWLPVFVLYFGRHLTPAEVLSLEAVYYAAIVVLEVPSGWMSDRIGRRRTLIGSGLGWTLGAGLIATASSWGWLAVGQGMLASGRALASGTDSSLVYETLVALDRADAQRAVHGRLHGLGLATLGAASLIGGGLGTVDTRWPYLASVASGLLATGVAWALVEPPRTLRSSLPADGPGRALAAAGRDPVLRAVLAVAMAMTVLVHIPYELQQPWLDRWTGGEGTALASGLLIASSWGLAALLSARAEAVVRRLGMRRAMALSMAFLGAVMAAMTLPPSGWVVGLLALRSLPTGLLSPLADAVVHPRLPSSVRATWLSVQSLAGRLAFSGALLAASTVVGTAWTGPGMAAVLWPAVVLALGSAVALWTLGRRLDRAEAATGEGDGVR